MPARWSDRHRDGECDELPSQAPASDSRDLACKRQDHADPVAGGGQPAPAFARVNLVGLPRHAPPGRPRRRSKVRWMIIPDRNAALQRSLEVPPAPPETATLSQAPRRSPQVRAVLLQAAERQGNVIKGRHARRAQYNKAAFVRRRPRPYVGCARLRRVGLAGRGWARHGRTRLGAARHSKEGGIGRKSGAAFLQKWSDFGAQRGHADGSRCHVFFRRDVPEAADQVLRFGEPVQSRGLAPEQDVLLNP